MKQKGFGITLLNLLEKNAGAVAGGQEALVMQAGAIVFKNYVKKFYPLYQGRGGVVRDFCGFSGRKGDMWPT